MAASLRLLIVDDSEDDALLMQRSLRQSGITPEWRRVDTAEDLGTALAGPEAWDVILCDHNMPSLTVEDAMAAAHDVSLNTPIIVVSGAVGEERAATLMRLGAADLILKSNLSRLAPAIQREITTARERKESAKLKRELQEVEQRYQEIYNKTPVMLHSLDAKGRLVQVSDYWLEHMGFARDEVIGRPLIDFLTHESRALATTVVFPEFFRNGVVRDAAYQFVKKNGEVFDALLSSVAERDDAGAFVRSFAAVTDVSARLRAEQEAERNWQFLTTVLESISDGIVACDAEGKLTLFNRATREFHGLPVEPLPPEEWSKHYSLMRADGVTPMPMSDVPLFRALNGEKVEEVEMVIAPKNGSPLRVLSTGRAMYDAAGNKRGAVVSMHDITARAKAERARAASEQRFRSAFESAGHGVALVGLDGRWLQVNEALCKMTGYSEEELLATDFQSITHPEDLDTDLSHVQSVLNGEIPSYQMEKRYFRRDGSELPAILSVGLVRDDDGEPLHFVSQIADISKLKEAEAKYHQAQRMEAVGNLTGGIAHDFNNILAVILGNLQLLQRRLKHEPRIHKMISAGLDATLRGADLTKRLLAFSRRQELDPKVVDVNEFVAQMDELLRRALGKAIKINTILDTGLGRAKVDPSQLESAILNLAINARDAMPAGGRLMIETSNVELDSEYVSRNPEANTGRHVCISVTDTGTGIPEDMHQDIFQPFFTTKEVGKGTGLGLSMVYGFVKQTGGHINVYSEMGHGTRFRLYLPMTDEVGKPLDVNVVETADLPTGTEVVLVVEDEVEVRETAALLLEELGYKVISDSDGPSALRTLEIFGDIDLLFTDMIMPGGMNGHELAERTSVLRPDIKVLLTSGYPRDAFHDGRKFPLISKPYTAEALARTIRQVLDGSDQMED